MTWKMTASILWETFQWVAMLGGALGVITGLLLIFDSPLVLRFGERMNRWFSTRQAMRPLETPIAVERTVYRFHRIAGVLILAGALYALYVLAVKFNGPLFVDTLARLLRLKMATWAVESARIFLIVVNAAAALIAIAMVLRPSALKRLEAWANRSYSAREATRPWETMRAGPDRLVATHPRAAGIVLAVLGAYVVGTLAYFRFLL